MSEELRERLEDLKAERDSPKYTYRVDYLEPARWGGGMDETHTRVDCDHVEVADGLVRFRLHDGTDVWTIAADLVIEYEL